MGPQIKFLNHAALQIEVQGTTLLCDPWASGTVFNDSWALLKERPINVSARNLCVWISHEHPDHLNFPTLKKIREAHSGPIRLYYRKQDNPNVRDAVTKLGFDCIEVSPGERLEIGANLALMTFAHGTDTAAVFEADGKIILNQNDCLLAEKEVREIKKRFPKIDVWLFQFSLAGYYGNEDDSERLEAARAGHIELIKTYFAEFQPAIYVPFASFVSFCKPGNSYLNAYRVTPEAAVSAVPAGRAQVLWIDDMLSWGDATERTRENLRKWAAVWEPNVLPAKLPAMESVRDEALKFVQQMATSFPAWLRPGALLIRLRDSGQYLKINLRAASVELVEAGARPDAEVGDDDLLFFFKFPWGADTLNITGNLKINSQFKWRRFAYLKHCNYVMAKKSAFVRGLVAIAGATLRSAQFYLS